jgi:hypothetical protein
MQSSDLCPSEFVVLLDGLFQVAFHIFCFDGGAERDFRFGLCSRRDGPSQGGGEGGAAGDRCFEFHV